MRPGLIASALVLVAASAAPSVAQTAARTPPSPKAPASPAAPSDTASDDSDTWIFSGVLQDSTEAFSGTLVTGKSAAQFELKLADGATCDGGDLKPSMGLVRLSEIKCTDGRPMRALFVPQAHQTLKVFGNVGDARFATIAHILGTQPIPEPKQTSAPHAPMPEPPAAPPPPSGKPAGEDPG